MPVEARPTPKEALKKEVKIKRAPPVTASELLGHKIEEPKGINLTESPIHGFLIERPGIAPEVLAVMPDRRMDGGQFFEFLLRVSPFNGGGEDDTIEHYRRMDPNDVEFRANLQKRHKVLGPDWGDFMEHFATFRDTLIQPPVAMVASIIENGYSFLGDFEIGRLDIEGEIWSAKDPLRISTNNWLGKDLPDEGSVDLRREYVNYGHVDTGEGNRRKRSVYYNNEDTQVIKLKAQMPDEYNVVVQVGEMTKAEIGLYALKSEWQSRVRDARRWGGLRKEVEDLANITTTNVVIPTLRLVTSGDGERSLLVDPLDESGQKVVDEFTAGYSFPPELRFESERYNPLVGLLTAAFFSEELRSDPDLWPEYAPLVKGGKKFFMGPAQVPPLALSRRKEIAQSRFVQALAEHVEKHAA